jgi:hypothetical protein
LSEGFKRAHIPVNIRRRYTPGINNSSLFFKDYQNQHYREFIEEAGDMEQIQQVLGLISILQFTTLQKFL